MKTSVSSDKRPVSIQTVSVGEDTADPKIKKRVDRHLRGEQWRREQAVGDLVFCHLQTGLPPKELVERFESLLLNSPKRNRLDIPESGNWPPDTSPIMTRCVLPLLAITLGIRADSVYPFFKAVCFEALSPVDPTGANPSEAKIKDIAKEAGVDRKSIRNWRRTLPYRNAVLGRRIALRVIANERDKSPKVDGNL
jgi:hypothetical protein